MVEENLFSLQHHLRFADFQQHAHPAHFIAVQQFLILVRQSVGVRLQDGVQIVGDKGYIVALSLCGAGLACCTGEWVVLEGLGVAHGQPPKA
ncbi:hypothetical protein [Synechococcus sp. RS9916]|uniref:hypothetical protein n=1 Tax=Synechococcus sp. RS9916 TaxID=221359 RepID=UPI00056F6D6A